MPTRDRVEAERLRGEEDVNVVVDPVKYENMTGSRSNVFSFADPASTSNQIGREDLLEQSRRDNGAKRDGRGRAIGSDYTSIRVPTYVSFT